MEPSSHRLLKTRYYASLPEGSGGLLGREIDVDREEIEPFAVFVNRSSADYGEAVALSALKELDRPPAVFLALPSVFPFGPLPQRFLSDFSIVFFLISYRQTGSSE
jgi:hypothetical protein